MALLPMPNRSQLVTYHFHKWSAKRLTLPVLYLGRSRVTPGLRARLASPTIELMTLAHAAAVKDIVGMDAATLARLLAEPPLGAQRQVGAGRELGAGGSKL